MVSRLTWAPPHMAVGYSPGCSTKPGMYPCYPIMSRFGLTGLGRGGGGARGGAAGGRVGRGGPVSAPGGGGPIFVGSGPSHPRLGGRVFGRGFRFPSSLGPFFSDGNWGGSWPWGCPWWQLPTYPVLPQHGLMGTVNPLVPRYGMSGLTFDGTGIFGTGLFSSDLTTWGIPEGIAALIGAYAIYAMFFQAKQTKYRLEGAAQRRRKTKAARYRAKAKALEEKELGGIFA